MAGVDHHARRRLEELLIAWRNKICSEYVYATLLGVPLLTDARLDRLDHGLEGLLEILHVRGFLGVQDHEICGETLEVPVLVCPQHLSDQVTLFFRFDAHQTDWEVSGYSICPEAQRSSLVSGHFAWRCSKRGVGEDQPIGEALEQVRLILGHAQVV